MFYVVVIDLPTGLNAWAVAPIALEISDVENKVKGEEKCFYKHTNRYEWKTISNQILENARTLTSALQS